MATQWNTFPIEFRGGLISNLSPLQHGTNAVGSATILQNFEANKEGGYTKIKGYEKYSTSTVPGTGPILALKVISSGRIVAARKVDSAAITSVNTGFTGTANVNGAITSTTTLVVDGNSGDDIVVGMQVTGTGISGKVTVVSVSNQTDITLSSAQTLSDNTVLTFQYLVSGDTNNTAYYYSTGTTWNFMAVSASANGGKARNVDFNLDGDDKTVFVDGTNYPAIYNASGNTVTFLSADNTQDVSGSENVAIFKSAGFYAKGNNIIFAAPFTVDDFDVGNGSGTINVGSDITGLAVFREQLIVFTKDSVKKVTGSTYADYQLAPITDRIGCINGDTIQEVGGDIIYLAPDGIRLLSATDRIGDFALDVASDKIQKDAIEFLNTASVFSSTILREKAQYRIFAYVSSERSEVAKGLIATKFISQGASGLSWSTTKGIKAYVADSSYANDQETIAFSNEDGYVYILNTGNTFDSSLIEAIYESPFMPLSDPQVRKTFYKMTLYAEPTGNMSLDVNLKYDFASATSTKNLQPSTITINSTGNTIFEFGASSTIFAKRAEWGPESTTATANVNGATSSSTSVALDGNAGGILEGMTVTGTGISGAVTVSTVTDQNNIVLSSTQTLADDTALTFTKQPTSGQTSFLIENVKYDVGTDATRVDVYVNGELQTGHTVSTSSSTEIVRAAIVTNYFNNVVTTTPAVTGTAYDTTVVLSSGVQPTDTVVIYLYPTGLELNTLATYGGELDSIYDVNVIGSGKTVALRIEDSSTNPSFTLDTALLEFRQNDRQ
jgi:hypothetical protein